MYRFIPPLIVLVPQDSNVTLYAQVCSLGCMLYDATVRLSSGKTIVLILHVDLISCWYF